MRAREFIKIFKINTNDLENILKPQETEEQPIMVSPLQQELELKKAAIGKESGIIQDILLDKTQDEEEDDEHGSITIGF